MKEGEKELERWDLIFTCLCSRTIHLETLFLMNTDGFSKLTRSNDPSQNKHSQRIELRSRDDLRRREKMSSMLN